MEATIPSNTSTETWYYATAISGNSLVIGSIEWPTSATTCNCNIQNFYATADGSVVTQFVYTDIPTFDWRTEPRFPRAESGSAVPVALHRPQVQVANPEERARKLLLSVLSRDQRRQLQQLGFFEVISRDGQRRYAIYEGRAGNVYRLDDQGQAVDKLCCHPAIWCPDSDTMLTQMLSLENEWAAFEHIANHHPMDTRGRLHRALVGAAAA